MPTQSLPVSPPPMTTTFLSLAFKARGSRLVRPRLFCSVPSGNPSQIRRFHNPCPAPQVSRLACPHSQADAVELFLQVMSGYVLANVMSVWNRTPSAANWLSRRSMMGFPSLKSGMPYRRIPPSFWSFSKTTTSCPALASCCAAANPAGPEPIIATLLPVFFAGWHRLYPALGKTPLDDLKLDVPDKHRLVAYRQGAGRLARRGTNPARDFREIVGRMKKFAGFSPVARDKSNR